MTECSPVKDANGCEMRPGDFVRYIGQGARYERFGWIVGVGEKWNRRWGADMWPSVDVFWTSPDGTPGRYPKRTRVSAVNCFRIDPPCPLPFDLGGELHKRLCSRATYTRLDTGDFPGLCQEDIDIPVRVRRSAMLERAEGKIRQAAETIQVAALEPYEIDVAEVGDIVLIEGETRRHRLVVVSQEWAGEALKAEDV